MAIPYLKEVHDIGILRADGTTKVGLMLARDKYGVPKYGVYDDEYLALQAVTGTIGYSNLPPEKELAITEDDWRAGMGLEYAASDAVKRYFTSTGMDMRSKGMGVAGPTSTTVTIPNTTGGVAVGTAATNESNMGFESAFSGNWTGDFTQGSNNPRTGTYNATRTSGSTGVYKSSSLTLTFDNGYRSHPFTFKAYGVTNNAIGPNVRIGINDGKTTTYCDPSTATSYTLLTHTKTLAADATALVLIISTSDFQNGVVDFDDCTLTCDDGYDGLPIFIDFNGERYMAKGSWLTKLDSNGDEFATVKSDFQAPITDLEVYSDSKLYIALGLSKAYWEMTTAEAFTENTLTVNKFKYFCFVHTTADTMYGSASVNTIYSTINPANGGTQWTGPTKVGDAGFEITNLIENSGSLAVMKSDIPYYLNSSGVVRNDMAPELATDTVSTDNGKNAVCWQDKYYIPWGAQALLEYDAGTNSFIEPANFCTNLSAMTGQVFAVAGDTKFLYAITDNSTKVEVQSGRYETIDGTTAWGWHPIAEITLTGCASASVSSVYEKRLWIGSTDSSEAVYYIPLTNDVFLTGTTMTTSWQHGNFRNTNKAWTHLELVMGHSYSATVYFTVAYQILGDTTWTTIGSGTFTDGTGTATGSPITLTGGANAVPITVAGTFTIVLPTGGAGIAATDGWTVTGSPVALVAGSNTITVSAGGSGNIAVTTGIYMGSSTSMTQSQFIPDDSSSNHPVSPMIRLMFTAVTGSTATTPKLLSWHLKGILRPDQREIIACSVVCADEILSRDGNTIKSDHDTVIATLNEARVADWPVTIYDIDGDTKTVNFLPVSPKWVVTADEKGRQNKEKVYNVLMQVVSLT